MNLDRIVCCAASQARSILSSPLSPKLIPDCCFQRTPSRHGITLYSNGPFHYTRVHRQLNESRSDGGGEGLITLPAKKIAYSFVSLKMINEAALLLSTSVPCRIISTDNRVVCPPRRVSFLVSQQRNSSEEGWLARLSINVGQFMNNYRGHYLLDINSWGSDTFRVKYEFHSGWNSLIVSRFSAIVFN